MSTHSAQEIWSLFKETSQQLKETSRQIDKLSADTNEQIKDLSLSQKQTSLQMKELSAKTNEQMKETDIKLNKFIGETGNRWHWEKILSKAV